MRTFKNWLLLILICSVVYQVDAQDSAVKSITIKLGKENTLSLKPPEESQPLLKYIQTSLPLIGVIAALIGIWYQIKARRKDDRLKNQLDRLNKQITEFYGPLYSLYETGHQNFYSYLILFGDDMSFSNPNYKQWAVTVFQPTNLAMENIIIHKADLVLGNRIPDFFLQFCRWLTTRKVYIQAQSQKNFNNDDWLPILNKNPHPEIRMQTYLCASFEILKETQSNLLSGKRVYINESTLIEEIKAKAEMYRMASESPETWENKVWEEIRKRPTPVKEQKSLRRILLDGLSIFSGT